MTSTLQQELLQQLESKALLEAAKQFAFEYLDDSQILTIVPDQDELALLDEFDEPLPASMSDPMHTLTKLATLGKHTTVKQTTGRYFGFVSGGVLPIGLAARWLADVWDQNAAMHVMSPIAAKLESLCEQWLIELLSLPKHCKMGLVGGTSVATLCGLAAARYRQYQKLDWDINDKGLMGAPRLRIIMGRQSHGTVIKMISLLGFGNQSIEWIECDDQGRMLVDTLPDIDQSCILVLQAGNVCSGAFDDFSVVCEKAQQAGAWVHIDGAFGLWALAASKFDNLTYGIDLANSWSVDAHKTLNTPYDCGIILCADPEALSASLHQNGSYLQFSEHRDSLMYTPDMSRRARSIDLWACLHYLGKQGVAELIVQLNLYAIELADQLSQKGLLILNDVVFNQVIVQCESDQITQKTLLNVQQSGLIWCGGAKWQGRDIIRISVCSWATTQADIALAATVFYQAMMGNVDDFGEK